MDVYQTDPDGVFVGTTAADPDPLVPGAWLIPGGCVTLAPPEIPTGSRARWTGAAWVIEPIRPGPPVAPVDPAAPVVPACVTAFQARAALLAAGLLDDVEAAVAAADRLTQTAWEYALAFERTSPTIATLAAALGRTDQQLDDLFREAATISA